MRHVRKPDRSTFAATALALVGSGLLIGAIGAKAVNPVMKEGPEPVWERGFTASAQDISDYERARREWLSSGPGGTRQAFAPEFAEDDLMATSDAWQELPPVWADGPAFRSYEEDLSLPDWDEPLDRSYTDFDSAPPARPELPRRQHEPAQRGASDANAAEPMTADGELPAIW